ncbi:hypothetical protein PQO03_10920 [Lentisphaera profundi]|uniref:Neuromedin U n=1 Tax=Lentisphaera profundi TaxID=1658616 RepID=A0ABY7VSM7_9BACT|nr:hypothetical protein [Lentisphaera profundi]WDE96220.1 hypothetical protein PQO03_10920 [Lentisphaera profundi]
MKKLTYLLSFLLLGSIHAQDNAPEGDDLSLAKSSQNPLGNLISVPFEFNGTPDMGTENNNSYTLNIKPVVPMSLGDDLTLINRFIIPVNYQESLYPDQGSDQGIGNITYQGLFSPKPTKSGIIYGGGPVIQAPSNSNDRFGGDSWAGGLAVVVLAKPGNWLFGCLGQHLQDFAGGDNVSQSSFQYFVNYNFENFYLTSTPTMVYDWTAKDSDDSTLIPVGGGVGKLFHFGKTPVDIRFQTFWNVERPDDVGSYTAQLSVKFLFPK